MPSGEALQLLNDQAEAFDLRLCFGEVDAFGRKRPHHPMQRLHIVRQGGKIDVHKGRRFKISPIPGLTADDLSFSKITDWIILGPSISSPMAHASVLRMLDLLKHPELKLKLRVSSIPFRAVG